MINSNTSETLFKGQDKDNRILRFLKAAPHLEFSEKGLANICKRFGVEPDYLQQLINQYRREAAHNGK